MVRKCTLIDAFVRTQLSLDISRTRTRDLMIPSLAAAAWPGNGQCPGVHSAWTALNSHTAPVSHPHTIQPFFGVEFCCLHFVINLVPRLYVRPAYIWVILLTILAHVSAISFRFFFYTISADFFHSLGENTNLLQNHKHNYFHSFATALDIWTRLFAVLYP